MKYMLATLSLLVFFIAGSNSPVVALTLQSQILNVNGSTVQLKVPEGMRVDYIAPLAGPRFLTRGQDGEFLIGSNGPNIYRLRWPYSTPETLVSLPGRNHSVALRTGNIFVAETGGLYSASYPGATAPMQPGDFSLVTKLPSQTGGHWSRTVITGPDGKLYIGLGISGNCSDEYLDNSYPFELRRGGVFLLDETGTTPLLTPYSSGLRNPIGLAFHPDTGALYATNAGPDNLGFDQPPEVLARLNKGSFHGMPWFQFYNGAFRSGGCATSSPPRPVQDAIVPSMTFAARSTPEGIVFVDSKTMGDAFLGNALIAIHGSWAVPAGGNSSDRREPKIVLVSFTNGVPVSTTDVVTGFQRADGTRFARPCGMALGKNGNLYFTSDSGEVTGLFRLAPVRQPGISEISVPPVNHLLLRDNTK